MDTTNPDKAAFKQTERMQPDEELVGRLIAMRSARIDLSDEDYFSEAIHLVLFDRLRPVLQDALGIHGEENQTELFPLAHTLGKLANSITHDVIALREGLEG